MYRECFICGRAFGANDVIAHLRVGRRIAFDVERGRLWIVCRRCGQWCLTPVEDRWEAIAECDARFRQADARVSTANVGLARLESVELIRIGTPDRDEIANWRYGPRFERRKRRAKVVGGVLGAAAGTSVAGAVYLAKAAAALTGTVAVGATILVYAGIWVYSARGVWGWTPLTTLTLPNRDRRLLLRRDLPYVELRRLDEPPWASVRIPFADGAITYTKTDALHLLHRLLPHANGSGATREQIAEATREVDRAEQRTARAPAKDNTRRAWEYLVGVNTRGPLLAMTIVGRLALEMAVAEEVERREMAGEVSGLAERWEREEEIARESDDMFLPRWIGDWIRTARRRPRPSQGGR